MAYNVAVDVGGTFTDVLVFDEESGALTEGKVLTTPGGPFQGRGRRDRGGLREGRDRIHRPAPAVPRDHRGDEHDPDEHRLAGRPADDEGPRAGTAARPRLDAGSALRLDVPPEARSARRPDRHRRHKRAHRPRRGRYHGARRGRGTRRRGAAGGPRCGVAGHRVPELLRQPGARAAGAGHRA